jgi:hypothetical protein
MGNYYSAIDLRGYPSSYFSKIALINQVNKENYKDILENLDKNKFDNSLLGIEIDEDNKKSQKKIKENG